MMVNHKHYTYRVTWSDEDQEYVGLCAEFPSLSFLDEDQLAALQGIVDLTGEVVDDMTAAGESVPEPLAERDYSGKFQVRVTAEIHRAITIRAAEQGVSLNRYVSSKLAAY